MMLNNCCRKEESQTRLLGRYWQPKEIPRRIRRENGIRANGTCQLDQSDKEVLPQRGMLNNQFWHVSLDSLLQGAGLLALYGSLQSVVKNTFPELSFENIGNQSSLPFIKLF